MAKPRPSVPAARPARPDQPVRPGAAQPRRPPVEPGQLWLYGRHAVQAALANPRRACHRLLATEEALARLPERPARPGLELLTVPRAELDRRLGTAAVHQGLALLVAPLPALDLAEACAPGGARDMVLLLDQINDPQNLGAILRSAAAFGVRAVVLPARHSAGQSGAGAKAASGALDLVPVVEVTNLARALDQLAELGYWRIALDSAAAQPLEEAPADVPLALVLGAEGSGLRRLVAAHCDLTLSLPMVGGAIASLNVSVAAGIALYVLSRR